MPTDAQPIIAVATGDPAGIGTEISMKAALDPGVRALYRPVLVGDPTLVARHAQACGIGADLQIIDTIDAAKSATRAIVAPPNTPRVIVAKLNAAVEEALKSEHAKDIFAKINLHCRRWHAGPRRRPSSRNRPNHGTA